MDQGRQSTASSKLRDLPGWDVPSHEVVCFAPRSTRYCVQIIVYNEGERLRRQLARMRDSSQLADIIICDGRSTDGSADPDFLASQKVRSLLITDEPGLCTATRLGLAYALEQGYDGIITIDGNGKDGVEALPRFIARLDQGYDLVQGSRFIKGGHHKNTPLARRIGIHCIMSPLHLLGSRYAFTDPTNGFRALSRRFLLDPRTQPIRSIFVNFNLQHYLCYRAARLGLRIIEIPVVRVYPDDKSVPTKIVGPGRNLLVLWEMLVTICGGYNPPSATES